MAIVLKGHKDLVVLNTALPSLYNFTFATNDQALGSAAYSSSSNVALDNNNMRIYEINDPTDDISATDTSSNIKNWLMTNIPDTPGTSSTTYTLVYQYDESIEDISTIRYIHVKDDPTADHSVQFGARNDVTGTMTFSNTNVDFDVVALGDLSTNLTEGFGFKNIFYQEGFDFTDSSAVAVLDVPKAKLNDPGLFFLNVPVFDICGANSNSMFDDVQLRYFTDVSGWPDISFSEASVSINPIYKFSNDQSIKKDFTRAMIQDILGTNRFQSLFKNRKDVINQVQDLDVSFNKQIREILGYITNAGFLTDADYGAYQKPEPNLLSTTKTLTVTNTSNGNKYTYNGNVQQIFTLLRGNTYTFEYPSGHPLRFSEYSNGDSGSGHHTDEYTTNVTFPSSTQTEIVVDQNTPDTLYYYCNLHSGMGSLINVLDKEQTSHLFQNYAFTTNSFLSYATGISQEDVSSGYHALQSSKFSAFNPLRILSSTMLGEVDADENDYYDLSGKAINTLGSHYETRKNLLKDDLFNEINNFWDISGRSTTYFGITNDTSYNVWLENNFQAMSVDASMVDGGMFSTYLNGYKVYIQEDATANGPDLIEEVVDRKTRFNFRAKDRLHLILEYAPPNNGVFSPGGNNFGGVARNRKYEIILNIVD